MTNNEIKEMLLQKNVGRLYHSNTISTSLSFLKTGGLLSRGYCEDFGLSQTPQKTDELDKNFGIFYDIFLILLIFMNVHIM